MFWFWYWFYLLMLTLHEHDKTTCPELQNEVSEDYANQGRNHGWKIKGDQGLGPNTGAPVPHARPNTGLGVGCGRGSPPPAVRVQGWYPRIFLKTQMLNPAFWWLLAVKFLAFWKLCPRSWGTNTLLVPQPKSCGPPVPMVVAPMMPMNFKIQTDIKNWLKTAWSSLIQSFAFSVIYVISIFQFCADVFCRTRTYGCASLWWTLRLRESSLRTEQLHSTLEKYGVLNQTWTNCLHRTKIHRQSARQSKHSMLIQSKLYCTDICVLKIMCYIVATAHRSLLCMWTVCCFSRCLVFTSRLRLRGS